MFLSLGQKNRLCCTFLSGVKCRRSKMYSLCNGRALGFRSLTVLVISVSAVCSIAHRNVSFISSSSWSRNCGSIFFNLSWLTDPCLWSFFYIVQISATKDLHWHYCVSLSLEWINSGYMSGRPSSTSSRWVANSCLLTDRLSDFDAFPLVGSCRWSRPFVS